MTEFGLSKLELENKNYDNVIYTLKKIGTIQKMQSALFLIREMFLTGKPRLPSWRICRFFFVSWCKKRSVGQLLGFHQKVLQPHPTKIYRLDQTVNILKINTIRLKCNISSGSNVVKMTLTPHNLMWLPINCD